MSKVKQSYNSYKRLSKKQTIIRILEREQRPCRPKEITWISKADSRFKALNHNTVKGYCRTLLHDGEISRPTYGYYEVTKPTYGMGAAEVKAHDLRLVWKVGKIGVVPTFYDSVGDVSIQVQFGRKRGKVSATIGCDEGMDYNTVCFAVDLVRKAAWEKAGINLDPLACEVCCEFNEDYINMRLDGFKCATVKSFLGNLERIYNKPDRLRSEVKIIKTDLATALGLLKGGVTAYTIMQTNYRILEEMKKITARLEQLIRKT